MRMEQLNAQALLHTNNDRYLLAVAVARRVNQLLGGSKPLVDRDMSKIEPTNIAIEEIAKGLLKVTID